MVRIQFKRQGYLGRIADYLMMPIMYVLQGTIHEVPQRTHRWNNIHLRNLEIDHLHADWVVIVPGDQTANERWFGLVPLFHMPIFGGWKKFIVIAPVEESGEWYIGWVAFDALGISRIPLTGPVRVCIGPRQGQFFGLDADGRQIPISRVGEGVIGKAGKYSHIPLR
jgi:hypothetical protein